MISNKQNDIQQEKKLKKIKNWTRWFNIIILTLKEKKFWNIVTNNCTIENIIIQITSYECNTVKVIKIIKIDVTDDIFKNIENTDKSLMI